MASQATLAAKTCVPCKGGIPRLDRDQTRDLIKGVEGWGLNDDATRISRTFKFKAFLEAHDIPCHLRGESLRFTHAISIDGIGAAEVLVPAALADTARDLLAQAERGELVIDDTTDTGDVTE